MKRTIEVGQVQDPDTGEITFDYQEAAETLQFILDTCDKFGGAWGIVTDREEYEPGRFRLRRLLFQFDSFSPAQRTYEQPEPVELAEAA